MTIQIPQAVQWLVPIVVGTNWPEGDEDALRRLAQAWEQVATALNQAIGDGDSAARAALGAMQGAAADAFAEYWNRFVDGDQPFLVTLRQACEQLSAGCDEAALNIEHAKLSIIAALIILAAQIAAMIAAAWATLGASTAGVPIAQIMTRISVWKIILELIKQMGIRGAVNAAINVGVETAIQGLQHGRGHRKDWDHGDLVDTGISGLVAGATAGTVGGISTAIGITTTNFAAAALRGAGEGALAGAVGNYLNEARHGDFIPDLENFTSGAVSGGVGGALDGTTNRHRGLDSTWHRPDDRRYIAGPNHLGWRFTTENGAEVRANVEDPYIKSWNPGGAQHIPRYSAPNAVDVDEDDYRLPTTPEADRGS